MARTFEAQIEIDAPASEVWAILADVAHYEWNTFCPQIDGPLVLGGEILLHVQMKPAPSQRIRSRELVTVIEPGQELSWDVIMAGGALLVKTRRRQWLEPLGESRCRYRTTETMGGLLSPLIKALYGEHIQRGFDAVARDLKVKAETRAARTDTA